MLVEEFKRRYERPHDQEMAPPIASLGREREPERMPRPTLPPWAPIAFVLVVIVAALFVVGTVFGGSNKSSNSKGLHSSTRRRTTPTHTQAAAAPKPPQNVTLQLTPTAPVYVCLVQGNGKPLIFEQTFSAGEKIPTYKRHKLFLTLGNASVQMKVNGKPYPVAESNSAIRFELTPTTVQKIPMNQTPTCP